MKREIASLIAVCADELVCYSLSFFYTGVSLIYLCS